MRYIVSGEFTEITETSGTIQNTSKINVVEVSDTNEKGSGIMLYPLEKFTFSNSLYARCVDGGGAEVRVVPFEVGTQGGGEQSTTPSGGGSGIAFAGMILGTESSTVDGGLWYDFDDGLPVVKMNYSGGEFLIDTHFDGDNVIVGDVLYLGGHRFKLTGFADGLTFSDNNFYAGGNSAPIGSVSSFAFQFTDAGALSVADGGTISVTQLDTNTVDYTLDLEELNKGDTEYKPWYLRSNVGATVNGETTEYTADLNNGKIIYIADGSSLNYLKTDSASYTKKDSTENSQTVLQLQISPANSRPASMAQNKAQGFFNRNGNEYYASSEYINRVKVEEIRNGTNGTVTKFIVTIMSDAAIQQANEKWINEISAESTAEVEIKFSNDVSVGTNASHTNGSLTRNDTTGVYTFKTDKYVDGYYTPETSTTNKAILEKLTVPEGDIFFGDECTLDGFAEGLCIERTGDYLYNIYKNRTYYTAEDQDVINSVKQVGDVKNEGTLVGTINKSTITITNKLAFNITDENSSFTATVIDNQDEIANSGANNFVAYKLTVSDDLKGTNVAEGFTYDNGTYTYRMGGYYDWHFSVGRATYSGYYKSTNTVTYASPNKSGIEGLDLQITGLPDLGDLRIISGNIYTSNNYNIGSIDADARTIGFLFQLSYFSMSRNDIYSYGDTIAIMGNNNYTFSSCSIDGSAKHCNTYIEAWNPNNSKPIFDFGVDTYSLGFVINDDGKTATYYSGISCKSLSLTKPAGYYPWTDIMLGNADPTELWWKPTITGTAYAALSDEEKANYTRCDDYTYILADETTYIKFCEFDGKNFVLNSHAFDNISTGTSIAITSTVRSTPTNFDIELATDADTLAISRTFANETFTAGATAGTYTYTATGTTAGWNVSADNSQIASWEFNGKTFTIENLRTDLGTIGFDSQGYIHATNGSTIGRMGGNVIKLYDTAVHKLATPTLSGTDATDFTLILPN